MDGEGLYAAVLQLLGQLGDDEVVVVPAQSCLGGDGSLHGVDHGTGDVEHQRHVAQHAGPGALAGHLLHGAAEVQVDDVGMSLFHNLGGLDHRVNVAPVDLYAHGSLVVVDLHLLHGRPDVAHDGLGGHKLRVHHVGAVAFAQLAEPDVGHVLHGCEEQWVGSEFDI